MTHEELAKIISVTPNKNKAIRSDRMKILTMLSECDKVYVYSGGKNLNIKKSPPKFYNVRFIIKPIIK